MQNVLVEDVNIIVLLAIVLVTSLLQNETRYVGDNLERVGYEKGVIVTKIKKVISYIVKNIISPKKDVIKGMLHEDDVVSMQVVDDLHLQAS